MRSSPTPLHPYTRALAGAFPTLGDPASRLAPGGLPGDPPDLREEIDGCPFAPRCPEVEDRCRPGVIPSASALATGPPPACTSPATSEAGRPWLSRRAEAPRSLEARDLAVTFPPRRGHGAARAVDGVNLALGRGEVLALIGESGCGKSTLARALVGTGRADPRRDPVRRQAAACAAASGLREFRRHVQLVLQDPYGALNPRQNVYDAVAEGLRLARAARRA